MFSRRGLLQLFGLGATGWAIGALPASAGLDGPPSADPLRVSLAELIRLTCDRKVARLAPGQWYTPELTALARAHRVRRLVTPGASLEVWHEQDGLHSRTFEFEQLVVPAVWDAKDGLAPARQRAALAESLVDNLLTLHDHLLCERLAEPLTAFTYGAFQYHLGSMSQSEDQGVTQMHLYSILAFVPSHLVSK